MAVRTTQAFTNTYNSEATTFLRSGDRYISNMESGIFLDRSGLVPFMFEFAFYYMSLSDTSNEVANNALDYIIVKNK